MPDGPLLTELERLYGPLSPLDSGMQSRVYTDASGQVVVKVYRNRKGEHQIEADNLRRAGLGEWVLGTYAAGGAEALVMRRFEGQPVQRADVRRALPRIREVLNRLHASQRGEVDLSRLRERLKRFRSALAAYPLSDLFDAVEQPLSSGWLRASASFCHLDLWHDNILIAPLPRSDVLIIDWTKAGWDDPMRDLALLTTGTLDLLPRRQSLDAALELLPAGQSAYRRFRAYLAHTYLHDLYWFLMNEPYEFDQQMPLKVSRARYTLGQLPER